MADDKLKTPVHVRAVSIKAVSLPVGFSPAYQQYVLSQAMDFTQVAGKANQAAGGAYDAQVRNDAQDVILLDHEIRLDAAEATIANHETRITSAEAAIVSLNGRLTTAENDIDFLTDEVIDLQTSVGAIQTDYVSKSATASQTLAGPLNVTTSYSVGGTKVIGARQTGWTAATGTALLAAFNADQSYTVSATYTQSEIQAMAAGQLLSQRRIKALEDALRTHGLID